jgi:ETFB lysine methyltransferase
VKTISDRALRAQLARRFTIARQVIQIGRQTVTIEHPESAEALISEDDFVRDERLPYWAELWPSSRVMADVIAAERGAGRSLLELGCGLGLVATCALLAGFRVTATDYYDDALLFTRHNGIANAGRAPETCIVDWRALPEDLSRYDRVVAADVLYERPYAVLIADAIVRTLAPGGEAIVTDPRRITAEQFLKECRARELDVSSEVRIWTDGQIRQRISVHRITRHG